MRKQRKRMSTRAIAAMKRENRTLRSLLDRVTQGYGTDIAHGTICTSGTSAVLTAHKLGYVTLVRQDYAKGGEALKVVAVKLDV